MTYYVDYQKDKVSKTETATYHSRSKNGDIIFVKDFNGKTRQLKRSQIIRVYDSETKKFIKI